LHDYDKFDCEIYIPDVEMLQMCGDTILVPKHIMNKLDEHLKMKQCMHGNAMVDGTIQDAKKDHYTTTTQGYSNANMCYYRLEKVLLALLVTQFL
jgi:ABC-type uncharacterized transport system ATPase subunit